MPNINIYIVVSFLLFSPSHLSLSHSLSLSLVSCVMSVTLYNTVSNVISMVLLLLLFLVHKNLNGVSSPALLLLLLLPYTQHSTLYCYYGCSTHNHSVSRQWQTSIARFHNNNNTKYDLSGKEWNIYTPKQWRKDRRLSAIVIGICLIHLVLLLPVCCCCCWE